MSSHSKARTWVFTLQVNTPALRDTNHVRYLFESIGASWAMAQLERAETQQLHWQGVMRFKNARSFNSTKAKLGKLGLQPHLEPCIDLAASIKYCSKEESFAGERWEFGERPKQGARADLKAATDMIMEGKSVADVAAAMPSVFVRNHRGLSALQSVVMKPYKGPRSVWIHFGETGYGKTFAAIDFCDKAGLSYAIIENPTTRSHVAWMDPVTADTDAIIFDDFDPDKWPSTHLLRVCDRYQVTLRSRELGSVPGRFRYVFFTCRQHPIHWGWDAGKQLDALLRRCYRDGGIRQFGPLVGPIGSSIITEERLAGDALVYAPGGLFPEKVGVLVAESQDVKEPEAPLRVRQRSPVIVLSDIEEDEEIQPMEDAQDPDEDDPIIWTPPKDCLFHIPRMYDSDDA